MPARVVLTVVIAAVLVAGCGRATPHERDGVRAAAATFLLACAEGEGTAAIEGLTEPTRREFLAAPDTLAGCKRVLGVADAAGAVPQRESLRAARVVGASAHGGFGHASIELPGGIRREVEAESVAGRWLLANPPPAR